MSEKCLWDGFRKGSAQLTSTVISAFADHVLISKNVRRIAIHFWSASLCNVSINDIIMGTTTDGMPLVSTFTNQIGADAQTYFTRQPISITQATHGNLATHQWHAVADAQATIVVCEVFADEHATGLA